MQKPQLIPPKDMRGAHSLLGGLPNGLSTNKKVIAGTGDCKVVLVDSDEVPIVFLLVMRVRALQWNVNETSNLYDFIDYEECLKCAQHTIFDIYLR